MSDMFCASRYLFRSKGGDRMTIEMFWIAILAIILLAVIREILNRRNF
jgi:uncharacterized membrane protein YvlD (DUF360 family)